MTGLVFIFAAGALLMLGHSVAILHRLYAKRVRGEYRAALSWLRAVKAA